MLPRPGRVAVILISDEDNFVSHLLATVVNDLFVKELFLGDWLVKKKYHVATTGGGLLAMVADLFDEELNLLGE